LLALVALCSLGFSASSHAAVKPQIVDAKGDAVGGVSGTDIHSVLFQSKRKGKGGSLIITLTLDAPANRTPGVLYRVFGKQNRCGSFQLSSAATLALIEQNQVYMTCGEPDATTGSPSTIINVTPETVGNKLIWTVGIRELPDEMQSGTMSELQAFVTPAEPVFGIINTADEVPAAAFDSAAGTSTFSY
jgi:hypothetical protein